MRTEHESGPAGAVPRAGGSVVGWRLWAPFAAIGWSLSYAALGIVWAASGHGFPYGPEAAVDPMGPLIARLGPGVAWAVVIMAGIPAAGVGAAMLCGVRGRRLRPLFISAGTLLAAILLLLMTGLTLLVLLGYLPYAVIGIFKGAEIGQKYLSGLISWPVVHQLLCLVGGFLWLAATVSYARTSGDACLYCGRRDGSEGWQTPSRAARWGRFATYLSMVAPAFYALTRYAWALGIPLGMSDEALRRGQANGMWISGLSLATFGLVGVGLTLGLVQRWGEVFPRWMIGLAGRRVPITLAVVPASVASVLVTVGGVAVWSHLPVMISRLAAGRADGAAIVGAIVFEVGPVLLFPTWGIALSVATLGYYYRRRRACRVCGRGEGQYTFGAVPTRHTTRGSLAGDTAPV